MAGMYIHIGTHKTGTTTIQHALRDASAIAGVQEGWEYLTTPRAAKSLMHAKTYDEDIVKKFSKELDNKVSRTGKSLRVIMSNEGLSGMPTDGYLNSSVIAAMLRDITKDFDAKIIIYLRRQDDMAESMYIQKIHEGGTFSFDEFISQLKPGLSYNYSRILKDWASCFGKENLIVRSYHSACQRGLLDDFGEVIGSAGIIHAKSDRKNPSYSNNAIQIARIANSILNESSRRRLRWSLQKTMAKQKSESHSLFSADIRNKFMDVYKESNQDVANQFFSDTLENVFPAFKSENKEVIDMTQINCIEYKDIVPLIVELISAGEKKESVGVIAGAKVALSGYPRLKGLLRRILRRA